MKSEWHISPDIRSTELQNALLTVALKPDINCDCLTSDQKTNIINTLLDFANLFLEDGKPVQNDKIIEAVVSRLSDTAPNQLAESRRVDFLEKIWKLVCKFEAIANIPGAL